MLLALGLKHVAVMVTGSVQPNYIKNPICSLTVVVARHAGSIEILSCKISSPTPIYGAHSIKKLH